MKTNFTRKTFLSVAGAFAGSSLFGAQGGVPERRRSFGPNEKLRHACIGVGGMMGGHDFGQFKSHARTEIVAICDVDENNLARAGAQVPNARRYRDWREMLEKEDLDSINVTVPDHQHAIITRAAMAKGKNVYCQKPLCHDVAECRQVAEDAAKYDVITQLGTQHAAGGGDRLTVQYLRQGMIGAIKRVYLCSNRTGAEQYRLMGPLPPRGIAAPKTLAWDLWLGTAPVHQYVPEIFHPSKWRTWIDFGTGWSGDIGCHIFDAVWKGMNLGAAAPKTVRAQVQEAWKNSPARRKDAWPQSNHITWEFDGVPATDGKPFTMEWFDGEFYPPEEAQAVARAAGLQRVPEEACVVIGTEGSLVMQHAKLPFVVLKDQVIKKHPKMPYINHYHEFLDACLANRPCASTFQKVGPMAETIILGTVANRCPEEKLVWNPTAFNFANSASATKLLRRDYRKGW